MPVASGWRKGARDRRHGEARHVAQPAGASERIGLNTDRQGDFGDFRVINGNGNEMTMFEAASFDLVLCNSTLEHDARFWLTLKEIRRVLSGGGIAMLGVPGYAVARGGGKRLASAVSRLWSPKLPGGSMLAGLAASTPALNVHNFPADYYRFSVQAVRDVFLEDFDVLTIEELMTPPRIIGVGRKR